jgi:hypothetical protein
MGVLHGYGIDTNQTWKSKIDKIKSCLQVWNTRDLTYAGKVNILNTYVIPIIMYKLDMREIEDDILK